MLNGYPPEYAHLQLYGWTVARLAGYLDFGNLGLLNLNCLA